MLNRHIARLRLLGVLFCLTGGAAIAGGWAGTARVACVDCQIPYLLSGGAAGVALTIVGVGLLLLAQIRLEGTRIAERIGVTSKSQDDAARPVVEPPTTGTSWTPGTNRPVQPPIETPAHTPK